LKRRKYKVLKIANYSYSKYFKQEDAAETLTNLYVKNNFKTKTHTYKSGAKYSGKWLGGFRHGFGKMWWLDGARFEG
jgi:hypothetical protein